MLAIVWALDNLRNYLYGAKKIKILTDHQPLTFTLSNRNNNSKLKRWKSRIEEYNYELVYKPGSTNKVAYALSRLKLEVNALTSSSDNTAHSAEEDSTHLIQYCQVPLNVFRTQLVVSEGNGTYAYEEPHDGYHRHFIAVSSNRVREQLTQHLKEKLNTTLVNVIKIPEHLIQMLQEIYQDHLLNYKIRITQRIVEDIRNDENKCRIIQEEHKRAHRNGRENKEQILEKYYFPQMASLIKKYTQNCEICNGNKYDRHPNRPELQ